MVIAFRLPLARQRGRYPPAFMCIQNAKNAMGHREKPPKLETQSDPPARAGVRNWTELAPVS